MAGTYFSSINNNGAIMAGSSGGAAALSGLGKGRKSPSSPVIKGACIKSGESSNHLQGLCPVTHAEDKYIFYYFVQALTYNP